MARPDAERVWLGFAQAALSGLAALDVVKPDGKTWSHVDSAIAEDACTLADAMLERWRLRYEPDKPGPSGDF